MVLTGASTQGTEKLPNAPSTSKTEPSLEDLGFPAETTKSDPKEQARLDRRTHMLKIHQRLGLITTIPMVAAIVSSAGAGGKQTSTTSRNLHVGLGALAGDLYFTTAYQFAGQTSEYKQLPFQLTKQGNKIQISGTIPATLADFKIDPPSLLPFR